MTKTEAVTHFGSQKNLGQALGKAKATVSGWPEQLPRGVQFEIQVKTKGALKADPIFFENKAA